MPPTKPLNGTPAAFGLRRLEQIAVALETKAAAIRTAMAALSEVAHEKARARGIAPLQAAIDLDAKRRQLPKNKQRGYGSVASKAARRKRTLALLAQFGDTPKPAPKGTTGLGPLLIHGYLKRKGDGLVRTAKAFTP